MAKHPRLTLTRDGERAFGRLADGIGRALDFVLRVEHLKKKDLAEKAGVDQAIVSRVLDGSRNLEIRTVGAIFGAAGYALDVTPKRIRPPTDTLNNRAERQQDLQNITVMLRNEEMRSAPFVAAPAEQGEKLDLKLKYATS